MIKKAKPFIECDNKVTNLVIYRVPAYLEYVDSHGDDLTFSNDKWELYKKKDITTERNSIADELEQIRHSIDEINNPINPEIIWELKRLYRLEEELRE